MACEEAVQARAREFVLGRVGRNVCAGLLCILLDKTHPHQRREIYQQSLRCPKRLRPEQFDQRNPSSRFQFHPDATKSFNCVQIYPFAKKNSILGDF
jgi:hypothetical protein